MDEHEDKTSRILITTVKVLLFVGAVLSAISFAIEHAPIDWESLEGDDWNLKAIEGEPGKDFDKIHTARCSVDLYETQGGYMRVYLWQRASYDSHLCTARVDENSELAKRVYRVIADGKEHRMTLQLKHSKHFYIDFELVGVEKWK